MKQLLMRQLKNVPDDQKQKILAAFEKNPDFFKEIAEEIQKRVASGENQMAATMAVVSARKEELAKLLQG